MRRITTTLGLLAALLFLLPLALLPLALLAQTLPELPRSVPDVSIPVTTRTIRVPAGDAAALQAALDTARAGDAIVLPDRSNYTGTFVLKPHGPGVVVLRSETVPTPGVRVTPATAATFATLVPVNVDAALTTADGANGWRVVGIAVRMQQTQWLNYGLVRVGRGDESTPEAQPTDVVLDRVYIDAGDDGQTQRCLTMNGRASALVNSWLANCHCTGFDSQGIIVWSGIGPHLIQNNHIEGAGQNIMYGGADPTIRGVVPSDITIRDNDLYKPLSWGRGKWTVKAAFEIKFAKRVLYERNVIENHWADAQTGNAILLQAVADHAPWITIQDVTMRNSVVRNVTTGITILSRVAYGTADWPTEPSQRILLEHVWFDGVGTDPFGTPNMTRFVQLFSDLQDVTVRNNTFTGRANSAVIFDNGGTDRVGKRLQLTDNVFGWTEYGMGGSGQQEGRSSLAFFQRDASVTGNVFTGRPSWIYPDGNLFPAEAPSTLQVGRAGVDTTRLRLATAPVVAPPVVVAPLPPDVRPVPPVDTPPVLPPVVAPSLETAPAGFPLATGAGRRTQVRTERTVCREGDVVRGVVTLASPTRYQVHVIRGSAWVTLPTRFTSRAAAVAACYAN